MSLWSVIACKIIICIFVKMKINMEFIVHVPSGSILGVVCFLRER